MECSIRGGTPTRGDTVSTCDNVLQMLDVRGRVGVLSDKVASCSTNANAGDRWAGEVEGNRPGEAVVGRFNEDINGIIGANAGVN